MSWNVLWNILGISWNIMEYHGISWNILWSIPRNIMEHHGIYYGIYNGMPWNIIENTMEYTMEHHGISTHAIATRQPHASNCHKTAPPTAWHAIATSQPSLKVASDKLHAFRVWR